MVAITVAVVAVVGVNLNLSIWFALHTIFAQVAQRRYGPVRLLIPDWRTLDPAALLIALTAFIAMFRFKAGMIPTLAASAATGLGYFLATA